MNKRKARSPAEETGRTTDDQGGFPSPAEPTGNYYWHWSKGHNGYIWPYRDLGEDVRPESSCTLLRPGHTGRTMIRARGQIQWRWGCIYLGHSSFIPKSMQPRETLVADTSQNVHSILLQNKILSYWQLQQYLYILPSGWWVHRRLSHFLKRQDVMGDAAHGNKEIGLLLELVAPYLRAGVDWESLHDPPGRLWCTSP